MQNPTFTYNTVGTPGTVPANEVPYLDAGVKLDNEATPRDGTVSVGLKRQDDTVLITIADTGEGMSEEFIRERLFKPFESTKSAGMGIGVFESGEYIAELGGKIELVSEVGAGTTYYVHLPLHQKQAQAQTHDIAA